MENALEPILGRSPDSVSISNSEIQTFKDCPRKWWLTYYRGLKQKAENHVGPLPLGTRIHNALEDYYVNGGNIVDSYTRLQNADNLRFLASGQATQIDDVKKFNSESELGRIMVEGYVEWLDETNADAKIEVIGAEKKLSHRLVELDKRVELIGKVDLRIRRRSDGSRATFDHKSAVSFNNYYDFSHMSEQLMHYTMLEKLDPNDDSKVDGGIYNLLKKVKRTPAAKPPFYERVDVRFNKKQLNSFWTRTMGTVSNMMRTRDALDAGANPLFVAYPRPRMDWGCGKCDFFKVCTMFDDGSDAEGFLEDHFQKIDPNARYGDESEES